MVVWYSARLAIAWSWVRILPVTAVYQRQFSVPYLSGWLMSTIESWAVNGHDARIRGLAFSAEGCRKQRSALPCGLSDSGMTLLFNYLFAQVDSARVSVVLTNRPFCSSRFWCKKLVKTFKCRLCSVLRQVGRDVRSR